MTRIYNVDANQAEIVTHLEHCGFQVENMAGVGGGFPDILVTGYSIKRNAVMCLKVEIKTEKGKLNTVQKIYHNEQKGRWGDEAPVLVTKSVDEILEWFGR